MSWRAVQVGTAAKFFATPACADEGRQLAGFPTLGNHRYLLGRHIFGPWAKILSARNHCIDETPDFLKAERSQKVSISDLLRRHPVPLLLALGASIVAASSYYLLLYIPTKIVLRRPFESSLGRTAQQGMEAK
jgi:hypothetical protein